MSQRSRRYEVLLPLRFNDGRQVPRELIGDTLRELHERFGAVSCDTQPTRGTWEHQGTLYHDEMVRAFFDVPDEDEFRQFFLDLKQRLKDRFQQLEVWITTYPLEVL